MIETSTAPPPVVRYVPPVMADYDASPPAPVPYMPPLMHSFDPDCLEGRHNCVPGWDGVRICTGCSRTDVCR